MFYPQKTSPHSNCVNHFVKILLIANLLFVTLFLEHQPVYAQCENAITEIPLVVVEPGGLTTTYRITNLENATASVTQEIYFGSSYPSAFLPTNTISPNGSMVFELQDYVDDINVPIPADAEDITLNISSDSCVTLTVLPNARFTPSALIGFAPLDVQFDTESLLVNEWTWDFGDDNTSSEESPVHTYIASGTYTVTLSISGDGGTVLLPEANPIIITVLDEKSRIHLPIIDAN